MRGMRIVGHGIDLVDIKRLQHMLDRHGQQFLDRCYTAGEQAYCQQRGGPSIERLAARFAAKEAVLKALGTGWRSGIAWTDVEVLRAPSGQPTVRLWGRAAEIATELGIAEWHLSLTHTSEQAAASVLAVG